MLATEQFLVAQLFVEDAVVHLHRWAGRISLTYVAQCERGERNVSLRNVLRLAGALDLDPGDLARGLRA